MPIIFFNGQYIPLEQASLSVEDRGFLLGDGLFETMKAYRGRVFCLRMHWQRLKDASDFLQIPLFLGWEDLLKISQELLAQNHLNESVAVLRLTLTRGKGPRGLMPPDYPQPNIMLSAFSREAHFLAESSLWVVEICKNERSPLARIKSLNYLENILAKTAAVRAGASEAVLLNTQGLVASASCANIFLKLPNGKILTPGLDQGILAGVTRGLVIEMAQKSGIEIEEGQVTQQDLKNAEEVFLTNSLIEIQGVNRIQGRRLPSIPKPHSITQIFKDAYQDLISGYKEI